jgi:putative membrane protein
MSHHPFKVNVVPVTGRGVALADQKSYSALMRAVANLLAAFVALEHVGFLVLEMFFWTKPLGLKIFRLTPQVAAASAPLAANQGLYNGFLAAGLVWGLLSAEPAALSIKTFFLSCVVVAGVFGAATASPSILLVQAAPALAALILVRLAR